MINYLTNILRCRIAIKKVCYFDIIIETCSFTFTCCKTSPFLRHLHQLPVCLLRDLVWFWHAPLVEQTSHCSWGHKQRQILLCGPARPSPIPSILFLIVLQSLIEPEKKITIHEVLTVTSYLYWLFFLKDTPTVTKQYTAKCSYQKVISLSLC